MFIKCFVVKRRENYRELLQLLTSKKYEIYLLPIDLFIMSFEILRASREERDKDPYLYGL